VGAGLCDGGVIAAGVGHNAGSGAVKEPTTQKTLAAFIGAYVYALTAIILRELDLAPDDQAYALFATTVLVLIYVVWSMVRWVLHLQTFGSLTDTTQQLEQITIRQLNDRFGQTIAHVRGKGEHDDLTRLINDCIVIDTTRSFEQDPRFGLIVLGEIGSKALSAGINDPGTAIDIISRQTRILQMYQDETKIETKVVYDRLWHGCAEMADAARHMAKHAVMRAMPALDFAPDRARLLRAVMPALRDDLDVES